MTHDALYSPVGSPVGPGPGAPSVLAVLQVGFVEGTLTPVDHIQRVLARLRQDPHNAVVALDEERALRDATELEAELRRRGPRSALHGVAVGVKDLIDVAGLPTRAGSAVLADAAPARTDAAVVARLRRAGAIVVGKLHTHEFGHGPTGDVAVSGPARNPHDLTRITGGSSSGPAAAVAAGHLPLAIGTDTGGSVRIPAALCGVVGLKPAWAALPRRGVFPLAPSLDHVGLIAADLYTALAGWEVIAVGARQDPVHPPRQIRVGVPQHEYWSLLDAPVAAAAARAAHALDTAGVQVVPVDTPQIYQLAAVYMSILGSEAYAVHAAALAERAEDFQPATQAGLRSYADHPRRDYLAAKRAARQLSAGLGAHLADIDALLTPTTRTRATPLAQPFVTIGTERTTVAAALLELTLPFNLTGWPALSLPAPGIGLPIGLQLVATGTAGSDERTLFHLARIIQAL
ncbi:amidase (plasmid) [Pseudonocardia bannensis]|uniref:Amidase n=1 Tax=Pseudonocardia bannensis TaxID=630973 RepID=A0A848DS69_9PSEU|nr:amidase [Pseudonocardia bannensis]NMH95329.1 amidase [Pseudonocardia bannensis]